MRLVPYSKRASDLFHRGSIALAQVEAQGIRIDTAYLDKAIRKTEQRIKELRQEIRKSEVAVLWKKTFGRKMKLGSTDQLGTVLFENMGFEPIAYTDTGRPKMDEASLAAVDHPFVKSYFEIKKLDKALGTYLKGLRREVVDGVLRPFFNLNTARTYRSSSQSPNFQNIPVRNEKIGKLIRRSFIARPGNHFVELDYGGIEVCIAACYHKDPAMISYIEDKSKDMHRDMAMECFKLNLDQVTKRIRYVGKNMFVFPQFYGDWYIDNTKHMWEAISTLGLELDDGTPMQEHLESMGIYERGDCDPKEKPRKGTFEAHIQKVEKNFWEKRFPVYNAWKKSWYSRYQNRGWFKTKTGFVCRGFMKRNEVINYPVQGSAFHCLLWSLIELVLEELQRHRMQTRIVGQIHDSIVADVPADELEDFLRLANYVMTQKIMQQWGGWITVPLEVEAEVAPVGASWFEKKEFKIPA